MRPEKEKDTSLPSNAVKLVYNQPSPEINPSATTKHSTAKIFETFCDLT
jgi:DNA repair protein RadC